MQIVNEFIFFGHLFAKLKVVDCLGLGVGKHFFEVVSVLRKNPLKVGRTLTPLSFLPNLSFQQYLPHHFLVIISFPNQKTIIIMPYYFQRFLLANQHLLLCFSTLQSLRMTRRCLSLTFLDFRTVFYH